MKTLKLFAVAALLFAIVAPPGVATARSHHRHHEAYSYRYGLPYPISYIHNYGPGVTPDAFAYYDGPATNHCYQGSAAYIGQDGQRHPCF